MLLFRRVLWEKKKEERRRGKRKRGAEHRDPGPFLAVVPAFSPGLYGPGLRRRKKGEGKKRGEKGRKGMKNHRCGEELGVAVWMSAPSHRRGERKKGRGREKGEKRAGEGGWRSCSPCRCCVISGVTR